ncbi:MAG: hypothetical protein CVV27_22130, partial [Candidatus Melainabacteria bacterium HGW-Melainabacteria-1]
MKSLTRHLTFTTKGRRDYINITSQVEDLVRESGIQEGLCLVNAMHITASVFVNDAYRASYAASEIARVADVARAVDLAVKAAGIDRI